MEKLTRNLISAWVKYWSTGTQLCQLTKLLNTETYLHSAKVTYAYFLDGRWHVNVYNVSGSHYVVTAVLHSSKDCDRHSTKCSSVDCHWHRLVLTTTVESEYTAAALAEVETTPQWMADSAALAACCMLKHWASVSVKATYKKRRVILTPLAINVATNLKTNFLLYISKMNKSKNN